MSEDDFDDFVFDDNNNGAETYDNTNVIGTLPHSPDNVKTVAREEDVPRQQGLEVADDDFADFEEYSPDNPQQCAINNTNKRSDNGLAAINDGKHPAAGNDDYSDDFLVPSFMDDGNVDTTTQPSAKRTRVEPSTQPPATTEANSNNTTTNNNNNNNNNNNHSNVRSSANKHIVTDKSRTSKSSVAYATFPVKNKNTGTNNANINGDINDNEEVPLAESSVCSSFVLDSTTPAASWLRVLFPRSSVRAATTPVVVNCLGTMYLNQGIDLRELACSLRNIEYTPSRSPIATLRLLEPRAVAIIRNSGMVSIVGARSVSAAFAAAELTARIIRCVLQLKELSAVTFQILSLMVRFDLQHSVYLDKLAREHPGMASYDPDSFCACTIALHGQCIVYDENDENDVEGNNKNNKMGQAVRWRISCNVYVSGKVTMIGARNLSEVEAAYQQLLELVLPCMKGVPPEIQQEAMQRQQVRLQQSQSTLTSTSGGDHTKRDEVITPEGDDVPADWDDDVDVFGDDYGVGGGDDM